MIDVEIRTPVNATETSQKVREAILAIFPDVEIVESEGIIIGRTQSVGRFKEILRDSRIRDTARSVILHGKQGGNTKFLINKQVAFVGKINFVERGQEPLGSLEVTIVCDDLDSLIDEIAPSTRVKREEERVR